MYQELGSGLLSGSGSKFLMRLQSRFQKSPQSSGGFAGAEGSGSNLIWLLAGSQSFLTLGASLYGLEESFNVLMTWRERDHGKAVCLLLPNPRL